MLRGMSGDNQASSHLETSLWSTCWCPLLQGIARLCCDARKQVRNHALTYLQRALLVHDIQVLQASEWEDCFSKLTWDRIDSFLPSLREEVFKTHENESRVSRDSSPAFESHQQQTPSHDDAVTNTTPTTQGPKTLPESLVASVPPLGLPSQYVLHPPLPSVTDLHTSTIPLILNQDVLQSTVIPFMPAKVKVDSAGQ